MAKTIEYEIDITTKDAKKSVENLTDEIVNLNNEIEKGNKQTETGLKDVKDASEKTAGGVKKIGTALKALGIGLILAAFTKFKEVLNENQKVADFFSTTFETLSLAFNDFFNLINNNLGTIKEYFKAAFDDPIQNMIDFGIAIKDNIIERIQSSLDTLGFLAEAVKKVFEGDFTGALDSVKNAGKELVDVVTGVDDSFDKTVDSVNSVVDATSNYVKETIKSAQANVELQKTAERARVLNQGLIEDYDRQAEQQRQLRDNEFNTIEDRIKANNKLKDILEEQKTAMLENANSILNAAQAQYEKNKNEENFIALQEAKNELAAVEAQITGFMSEQDSNRNALLREKLELEQSNIDATSERAKSERDFNAELIENDIIRIKRQQENLLLEKEQELDRLTTKRDLYKEGTQAYVDAENERLTYIQEATQTEATLKNELRIAEAEERTKIRDFQIEQIDNDVLRLEALKTSFEAERELEIKRLETKRDLYDKGTKAYEDSQKQLDAYTAESARNQVKIEKDLAKSKEAQLTETLGNLAGLVGQNTKFGKAIAVVQAIRDTYAGANKALAQGGIFGFIGAAAVIAGGLANVKQITSTKDPQPPAGASVSGGSSVSVPQVTRSAPPQVPTVGTSGINQLAGVIQGQQQQPIKAFVVSNDVTSAQALDRNIVEEAGI